MQFRQGDLLFTQIPSLPEGLTLRKSQVVAEGEVTGHSHRLASGRVLEGAQGMLFLEILTETQVVHQEHGPLTPSPGCYQVTRQREYSPKVIRTVAD